MIIMISQPCPQQRATAVAAVRPVPGHRIGFVTRVCDAENPASHRFGHSGTSAGIWVCDGPKCYSFDIIGFTTLICPFISLRRIETCADWFAPPRCALCQHTTQSVEKVTVRPSAKPSAAGE